VLEGVGTLQVPADVTPAEAAGLALLSVQITVWLSESSNPYNTHNIDWAAFVREHHLQRCFVKDGAKP
jgi:hypothetical protein